MFNKKMFLDMRRFGMGVGISKAKLSEAMLEVLSKFLLGSRNALVWNDVTTKILDKDISAANFRKLNELANSDNSNVNGIVTKLIKAYGSTIRSGENDDGKRNQGNIQRAARYVYA